MHCSQCNSGNLRWVKVTLMFLQCFASQYSVIYSLIINKFLRIVDVTPDGGSVEWACTNNHGSEVRE